MVVVERRHEREQMEQVFSLTAASGPMRPSEGVCAHRFILDPFPIQTQQTQPKATGFVHSRSQPSTVSPSRFSFQPSLREKPSFRRLDSHLLQLHTVQPATRGN